MTLARLVPRRIDEKRVCDAAVEPRSSQEAERVVETCRRVLRISPDDRVAELNLARALLSLSRTDGQECGVTEARELVLRSGPAGDPGPLRPAARELVRTLGELAARGGDDQGWEEALRLYAELSGAEPATLGMYADLHRHRSERAAAEACRRERGPEAQAALERAVREADLAIGFIREALTHGLRRAARAEERLKLGMIRVQRASLSWRLVLLRERDESFDAFARELAEVDEALVDCRAAVAAAGRGAAKQAARVGLAQSLVLRSEMGLRAHSLGLAYGVHDFGFLAALNEADKVLRFEADALGSPVLAARDGAARVRAEWDSKSR